MKLLIIGGPRTGKTTLGKTLAEKHDVKLMSTDDLIVEGWSEASEIIASTWMTEDEGWIIEGVAGVRALRKWLKNNKGPIHFEILHLKAPKVELTHAQTSMTKAIKTILAEIMPEVRRRGCEVIEDVGEL